MDCEDCYYKDEITGSCTNDAEECVDENQFVKALGPEDMFKILFMLIYKLGGEIEVTAKSLENEELKIEHEYDPKSKKYILTTKPQPPKPTLIKVPKKLMKPRKKKLIYPAGMN